MARSRKQSAEDPRTTVTRPTSACTFSIFVLQIHLVQIKSIWAFSCQGAWSRWQNAFLLSMETSISRWRFHWIKVGDFLTVVKRLSTLLQKKKLRIFPLFCFRFCPAPQSPVDFLVMAFSHQETIQFSPHPLCCEIFHFINKSDFVTENLRRSGWWWMFLLS